MQAGADLLKGGACAYCAVERLHTRERTALRSCVISLQEGKVLPHKSILLPPAAGSVVQVATRLHLVKQAQQIQVFVVRVCVPYTQMQLFNL